MGLDTLYRRIILGGELTLHLDRLVFQQFWGLIGLFRVRAPLAPPPRRFAVWVSVV